MKSAIVIIALVGYAAAGVIVPGVLNTGASSQFRSQDNIGNYAFGYNEDHSQGGTFRREQGGPGVQVGSYGLRDADGRTRVVNYVADAAGFRANVQTNEPGVDGSKDPANVLINKAEVIAAPYAVAPTVVAHAAPLAAPLHAAPIASYSTLTQHVSHAPAIAYASAPVVSHYASAPLVAPLAAPVAYATKTIHSPYLSAW
jgi:hypothetical protein